MTPFNLIISLASGLKAATANYEFPTQYSEPQGVNVYLQAIPDSEYENRQYYPYICVELLSIEDEVDISVASVLITVGTYNNETEEGLKDHLNLIEEIRRYLLKHPIINKKFSAIPPIYTGLVEKRSPDFQYSNIFVQYKVMSFSKSYADEKLYGEDENFEL
jgi:hypothetical protein